MRRAKDCSGCGVPHCSAVKIFRGRCRLCRGALPLVSEDEQRKVFAEAIQKVWVLQGISFEPRMEAPDEDDDDIDPWEPLVATWLDEERPKDLTVESVLEGVGLLDPDGRRPTASVRARIRHILTRVGRPLRNHERRRFAAMPMYAEMVKRKLDGGGGISIQEITLRELAASLGMPHDDRTQKLLGRCFSFYGWMRRRVRRPEGRVAVYCRPPQVQA